MANSQVTPHAGDRQHVPTDQAGPELLPCPFCGHAASFKGRIILCDNFGCNANVPASRTNDTTDEKADSLMRWNRRADLAAPSAPAEVERLREALTEIANAYTAHGYSDAMDAVQHLKDTAKEAING